MKVSNLVIWNANSGAMQYDAVLYEDGDTIAIGNALGVFGTWSIRKSKWITQTNWNRSALEAAIENTFALRSGDINTIFTQRTLDEYLRPQDRIADPNRITLEVARNRTYRAALGYTITRR
jgi:hypothetical protein